MKKTVFGFLKDIVCVIIGGTFFGFGLNAFVLPHSFLTGGAGGIAIILNRFFGVPTGTGFFIINIPLFIAAAFIVGKRHTLRTVYSCFLFSSVIDVIAVFIKYQFTGDRLVCAIYGGIFMGLGLYIIMLRSIVTGGSDLAAYLIQQKHPAYSISTVIMAIDAVIVIFGAIIYKSVESALYSVLLIAVLTLTLNTLLRGRTSGTLYFIFTKTPEIVAEAILKNLDRGVTKITAEGGYTKKDTKMLMCAVGRRQSPLLKQIVFECDDSAFVVVAPADSVFGNGFTLPRKEDIF